MGYSVATPIKGKSELYRMKAFMKTHFRTWPELHNLPKDAPSYISLVTDDLSYDHGKCRLGFDYNAAGSERDYAFAVCRWMALQVGRKRQFKELEKSFPHIVYDGEEAWPVIVRGSMKVPQEWKWALVDKWGIRGLNKIELKYPNLHTDLETAFDLIRTELKRLTKKWPG